MLDDWKIHLCQMNEKHLHLIYFFKFTAYEQIHQSQ